MINFHHGDAVQWANDYRGELFHALLCDPPYHLTSIVKRFGKEDSAPAKFGTDGVFARSSGGFMGKQWDGGDVAFRPETWAAFANVLHDGAFIMAFGSSRGYHRLACAIEDGGFVIHPSLFGWLQGQGFPKATRLNHGHPLAEVFKGHRYGLQAMKPSLEPIVIAQKPYAGRPIDCITRTGAGSLNVDGSRISHDEPMKTTVRDDHINKRAMSGGTKYGGEGLASPSPQGRWPANFYLGDPEAARRLDAQSGPSKSRPVSPENIGKSGSGEKRGLFGNGSVVQSGYYDDSDKVSRFFYNVREQIDDADPVRYCAKASRRERDAGLDEDFPLSAPPASARSKPAEGRKNALGEPRRNSHPTVKPLALTRYLATLLLPPAEYAPRRLFVPFAGVGSEAIGAHQAGWEFVQGVEITAEYLPIAQARAEYWTAKEKQLAMELDDS